MIEDGNLQAGMSLEGKAEDRNETEHDRRSHLCTSTGIAGEEASCQARSELSVRISGRIV